MSEPQNWLCRFVKAGNESKPLIRTRVVIRALSKKFAVEMIKHSGLVSDRYPVVFANPTDRPVRFRV